MKLIHFCSYYIGSTVYKSLFSELSKCGIKQVVYVPVRKLSHVRNNAVKDENIKFSYVNCLSFLTRIFFILKIFLSLSFSLLKIKKNKEYDVVHAHTLYSDGISAYLYCIIRKRKLVITVRNTDVNLCFKYYPHYKWLARKALNYSERIIFVSPAHMSIFESYFGIKYSYKSKLIENGISDLFVDNAVSYKKNKPSSSGLFIGAIDKNKNILSSILAFEKCFSHEDWSFTIVGGEYDDFRKVYGELPCHLIDRVSFEGRVDDKDALISFYDNSTIFVMPSYKETFGLVYLEAISRCLPVVYTKGQGIHGVFKEGEVGFSCDPSSIESICNAIESIKKSYPDGLNFENSKNVVIHFSWDVMTKKMIDEVYL